METFRLKNPLKLIYINQNFGENGSGVYHDLGMIGHNGIDFAAGDGMPVFAAHDGVVTFTGEDSSGGLGVVLRTTKTFEYKGEQVYFKSIYWHLQKNSFKVKPGDMVKAGDQVACADNTGLSTGSHLHFGIKPVRQGEADWQWINTEQNNGYFGAIDPAQFMQFYFTKNLFLGSKNSEVKKLQEFLINKDYSIPAGPTDYFGLQTRSALAKFQKDNGISPAVGYFGEITRQKVNSMLP